MERKRKKDRKTDWGEWTQCVAETKGEGETETIISIFRAWTGSFIVNSNDDTTCYFCWNKGS